MNPTKLIVAALLVTGLAAGLTTGLQACSRGGASSARPLSDTELDRLANMRMRNFGDGRVGVRGTVGQQGTHTSVNGWIDWRRALIYLSVSSVAQGSVALVQAKPGVLAIRPEATKSPQPSATPPKQPPADGWRVRPITLTDQQKTPLDNLVAFLFLMASDKTDKQDILKKLNTQWVRRDSAQNTEVDVILGPAVMPESVAPQPSSPPPTPQPSASPSPTPNPSSLDTYGGAVGYWLDAEGRLRKLETLLAANMPTTIELIRDDRAEIQAIDALGGRDIAPREVSDAEAEMLSLMRQRNFQARQAQVTLTLPAAPGTLRRGTGWLDWQRSLAYVSVTDLDDAESDLLVIANKSTVAKRKPDGRAPQPPPLPAPNGGWERTPWGSVNADVDFILYEAMSMALNQRDDAKRMKTLARRLRVDVLNGVPMGVFELPNALEQKWAPGTARVRYWLDNSGILRRVEIRTGMGGFAQLDLTPGQVPSHLPASAP